MRETRPAKPGRAVPEPPKPESAVLLVDPSLFTAPYDARLSDGLRAAGLDPVWATRPLRAGEEDELRQHRALRFFYRLTDGPRRRSGPVWRAIKGLEHLVGLRRLSRLVARSGFLAVHMQWLLVPHLDARAIRRLRRHAPVVLTVHDVEPFNGKAVGRAQRAGFDRALRAADRLIVHTAGGRDALAARGIDPTAVSIVPHGLLAPVAAAEPSVGRESARRWTIVQFGKIQGYKGVDLLVEALGRLDGGTRDAVRVIVAGEPMIDVDALSSRARALGLFPDLFEIRPRYQSAAEVDALIREADAFVFPYRSIEASGAFLLVASAGKWIVASDLGAFADLIGTDGDAGALVPPGDVAALAAAIRDSIGRRPARSVAAAVPDWTTIGRMTAAVYDEARASWRKRATSGPHAA